MECDTSEIPRYIIDALEHLHDVPDLIELIGKAIVDDPPAVARNGGVIRPGYSKELDSLKRVLILRKGLDRQTPGRRAAKDGHKITQDRVQQNFRLLH